MVSKAFRGEHQLGRTGLRRSSMAHSMLFQRCSPRVEHVLQEADLLLHTVLSCYPLDTRAQSVVLLHPEPQIDVDTDRPVMAMKQAGAMDNAKRDLPKVSPSKYPASIKSSANCSPCPFSLTIEIDPR